MIDFCDFESGDTCSWLTVDPKLGKKIKPSKNIENYPLEYIDAIWIVNSPSNRFADLLTDHTLRNKNGNYLYLKSTDQNSRFATLMSDRYDLQQSNGLCLEFYYYIHNDKSNDGQIIVWKSESIEIVEKIANLTTTNEWTQTKLSLKSTSQSKNMFIYLQGSCSKGNSYVAIDDLAVKKGLCEDQSKNETLDKNYFYCNSNMKINLTKVCDFVNDCDDGKDELNCGNCDFESGICDYTKTVKTNKNDFDWRIGNSQVGPKFGYSNSKGFIYASRLKGFSSIIPSVTLYSPTIQSCSLGGTISFAYYLSSSNASLIVKFLLIEDEEEIDEVILWKSVYEKNYNYKSYNKKTLNLIRRKVEFKIGFTAQIDYNVNSFDDFVAIDQIQVSSCGPPKKSASCNAKTQFKCSNQVCINSNQICDFNDNCNDGSDELNCDKQLMCDFENGLCDWKIENKSDNLWNIESGFNNGLYRPSYDHTIGLLKGHYLSYISPFDEKNFVDGTVFGPTIKSGNQCEMRFYIYIEGNFKGKFIIGIKNVKTNEQFPLKIYDKPFNNYYWQNDLLKLSSGKQLLDLFQIYFYADIKSIDKTDSSIAIDDVSFIHCKQFNSSNTQTPYTTTYTTPTSMINDKQSHSKGN